MATTVEKRLLTAEEFERLANKRRCELVRGEIVEMAPASEGHGEVENNAAFLITQHARAHKLGRVFSGELGVVVKRDPDTVRGADVAFYKAGRLPEGRLSPHYLTVVPDLVVEVVASDEAAGDLQERIEDWMAAGVQLLLVVFNATRSITAYRPTHEARILSGDDLVDGGEVLPGFRVPVSEFFRTD